MPPEYELWQQTLKARDMVAVFSGFVALAIGLVMARQHRHEPGFTKGIQISEAYFYLFIIILLGFGLRLFHLGQNALWYDEALTALTAQRGPLDILTIAKYSSHPPGYYLLMWLWSSLYPVHPPEWFLRFPSLVFGTVNIALTYFAARAFNRSPQVSLTAAFLVAVLPFQLFYSQEARMYQLLLMLVLMTAIAWQRGEWPLFIMTATGILYTQTMGALFLVALGILQLFKRGLHWRFTVSVSAIAVLYAPWVYFGLLQQVGFVQGGWIPQVTPGAFLYLWHVLLWGEANSLLLIVPGMAVSLMTVGLAIWFGVKGELYTLLTLTIMPPILAVIASLSVARVFLPGRPFITVTPFLYVLIAYSLWHVDWRRIRAGLLGCLLIIALGGYYLNPDLQKWPHRQWANVIEAQYQPGDAVFYVSHLLPFWWYLHDKPSYFLLQDDTAPNAGFNLSTPATIALGINMITPDQLTGYKRAFVLHAQSPAATPYRQQVYQDLTSQNPIEWQHVFVETGFISSGSITLIDLPEQAQQAPRPRIRQAVFIPQFIKTLYRQWQAQWSKTYVIFR